MLYQLTILIFSSAGTSLNRRMPDASVLCFVLCQRQVFNNENFSIALIWEALSQNCLKTSAFIHLTIKIAPIIYFTYKTYYIFFYKIYKPANKQDCPSNFQLSSFAKFLEEIFSSVGPIYRIFPYNKDATSFSKCKLSQYLIECCVNWKNAQCNTCKIYCTTLFTKYS